MNVACSRHVLRFFEDRFCWDVDGNGEPVTCVMKRGFTWTHVQERSKCQAYQIICYLKRIEMYIK